MLIQQKGVAVAGDKRNSRSTDEGDVGSTRQRKKRIAPAASRVVNSHPHEVIGEVKWVKATFRGMTKRLANVPDNLDELKIVLWNRFGALKNEFQDPGALTVAAELPKAKNAGDSSDMSQASVGSAEHAQ